ncbi:MAG: oligosaccharide flippase family protein [Epsilonproteobacteria bacterium]|nr:oligosaccharide flippase family protein [Campylobacterota bacterium]
MINKLKPKSEFSRNVLTLMTGTTIAQAIPIAISPILTRIYTPEDFGVFALYMSVASIVSVVATGRYELAIMLPKKDEDAMHLVVLSLMIAGLVSFIVLFIVYIFNDEITLFLKNPEIANWLYFIPLSVLMTGIYQSLNYWNNRKKEYRRLSINRILQSGTTATLNVTMGVNGFGSSGLIVGGLIGQGVATTILANIFRRDYNLLVPNIMKLKIVALAKKYIEFPRINSMHAFLNIFSSQLPIFLISYFFQNTITGFYSLANKVLLAPMNIITISYGQVFLQKMSSLYKEEGNEELKLYRETTSKLLLYSFPIFFIFFIFLQDIFSFIFGDKWEIAGVYAQILIPMLYLRFTGSIVSSVVIIYNKQKKALNIEIINTILRVLLLVIGGVLKSVIVGLILFSFFSFLVTLYRLFWYAEILKKENV